MHLDNTSFNGREFIRWYGAGRVNAEYTDVVVNLLQRATRFGDSAALLYDPIDSVRGALILQLIGEGARAGGEN